MKTQIKRIYKENDNVIINGVKARIVMVGKPTNDNIQAIMINQMIKKNNIFFNVDI